MLISTCRNVEDKATSQVDVNLVEYLRSSQATEKGSSPLWSPCLFSDTSRLQASATEVTCIAWDFDDGVDPGLKALLLKTGVSHIWHDTATHGRERLIVYLDRAVSAKDWPGFWANVTQALGITKHDSACKNVGRFYFVPLKGAKVTVEGQDLLPVDEFLSPHVEQSGNEDLLAVRRSMLKCSNVDMLAMVRLGLAGKPIAQPGARDETVNKLAYYLGKFVVPLGTSAVAVCSILSLALPGNESKSYWEKKFKVSFERGMGERLKNQEEREAVLGEDLLKDLQVRTDINGNKVIISNSHNANVILSKSGDFTFRKNVVEDTVELARGPSEFETMQDHDATNIANWLQKNYRVQLSSAQVFEQALAIAQRNQWDPISHYLKDLTWDGVHRIDNFLVDYLGCADTAEARLYSRKWLISMVARALRPGCKLDQVLVLQGAQGLGKSTALRLLSEPWFSDTKVVVGDKDSYLAASRFWVHEFAELASLKRGDRETIKAFFTSVQDSYRPPYGRVTITKPRRCLFVATTNEAEFLDDETGDRRYWVVTCTKQLDFKAISRDRDALLAEAVAAFNEGEAWWLESAAEKKIQRDANEPYKVFTAVAKTEAIEQWWANLPVDKRPAMITISKVVNDIWLLPVDRVNRAAELEAARCLRHLGFNKLTPAEGKVFYTPPEAWVKESKSAPIARRSSMVS